MDESFGEFVARAYASLVRTGYLLVGDRGHAEDLVQSALLRAMRSWPQIESPDAYVRTTMVRLAGRWGRRRWHGELPSPVLPDTAGTAVDTDITLDVRAALSRLPWQQRAVLVLRFYDDLTEAQIADALGCSVGTVKSRAYRALAALRTDGLLHLRTEAHDG